MENKRLNRHLMDALSKLLHISVANSCDNSSYMRGLLYCLEFGCDNDAEEEKQIALIIGARELFKGEQR